MPVLALDISPMIDKLLNPWVVFGFGAQFMFLMRFVIQWLASERRKRSYVPVVFWYFSLAGGIMLFTYAVHLKDPVFVLGQGLGCFIYIRNLILIYQRRPAARLRAQGRIKRLMDNGLGDAEADPAEPDDITAKTGDRGTRATGDLASSPPS